MAYNFSVVDGTAYVYETQDTNFERCVLTFPVGDDMLRDGDYGELEWDGQQFDIDRRGNADDDAALSRPSKDKGKERMWAEPDGDPGDAGPDGESDDPTGFVRYRVANGRCYLYLDDEAAEPYDSLDPEPGMVEHDYGGLTYYGTTRYAFEKYGNAAEAESAEYEQRAGWEAGGQAEQKWSEFVPVEPQTPDLSPAESVLSPEEDRARVADFQRSQAASDRQGFYYELAGDTGQLTSQLEAAEKAGEAEFGRLCQAADDSQTVGFIATDKWVMFGTSMNYRLSEVLETVAIRGVVRFTRHRTRPNVITLEQIAMGAYPGGDPDAPRDVADVLGTGTDAALANAEARIKELAKRPDLYPYRDAKNVVVKSSR